MTDLLGLGLTRMEGLLSSSREADWAIVRMLLLQRAGERILLTLPLRRGGEADRAGDSMLVMSLSCSGFCSPPSVGCRRAALNRYRIISKDDNTNYPIHFVFVIPKNMLLINLM